MQNEIADNCSTTLRMRNTDWHQNALQKLKQDLRMTIMAKRHARGEEELSLDDSQPDTRQLSEAELELELELELERKERRREQNRRAAQRCRRKKRINQMSVLQNYDWIVSRNQQLTEEVQHLRQETVHLQSLLNTCTCRDSKSRPATSFTSFTAHATLPALVAMVKEEPGAGSPADHASLPSPACRYGGVMGVERSHADVGYGDAYCSHGPVPCLTNSTATSMDLSLSTSSPIMSPCGGSNAASMDLSLSTSSPIIPCGGSNADGYCSKALLFSPGTILEHRQLSPLARSIPKQHPHQQSGISRGSPKQLGSEFRNHHHHTVISQTLDQNNISTSSPSQYQDLNNSSTSSPSRYQSHGAGSSHVILRGHQDQSMHDCYSGLDQSRHQTVSCGVRRAESGTEKPADTQTLALSTSGQHAYSLSMESGTSMQQHHGTGIHEQSCGRITPGVCLASQTFLEKLPFIPGGLVQSSSCYFQGEVSAPLSTDGRRSISSVSSDVSATSDKARLDVRASPHCDVLMIGLDEDVEDMSPGEVSQLLQQIHQDDLLFQGGGPLDDVFSCAAVGDRLAQW